MIRRAKSSVINTGGKALFAPPLTKEDYDFFNRQSNELKFGVSSSKQSAKKISIATPVHSSGLRGTFLIADPRLEMRASTRRISDLKISNRLRTGGYDGAKANTKQNRRSEDPSTSLTPSPRFRRAGRTSGRSRGTCPLKPRRRRVTTHHSPLTNHESSGFPSTPLTHPHPGPTLHPAFGPQLKILEE